MTTHRLNHHDILALEERKQHDRADTTTDLIVLAASVLGSLALTLLFIAEGLAK